MNPMNLCAYVCLVILMVAGWAAAQTIDIYPQSRTEKLDRELFKNPTAEYRGTPFWSWNCKLDKEQLLRQIDQLHEMGFGGFHIHARVGLDTEYLGDEFMSLVKACNEKGKQLGMLTWLYDEDRWPSGSAGGIVTRDPLYRAKHLLFTTRPYGAKKEKAANEMAARSSRTENGVRIARYQVILKDGCLASYRRLADSETPGDKGTVWYAYLETAAPTPWFNNQTYVDTLSRPAIERFVAVTYERYRQAVGGEFGKTIPAIFTDEPQFTTVKLLSSPGAKEAVIPFTDDFVQTYESAYGQKLLDSLPEIFWELPQSKASPTRYRYFDHLSERFASAFADTIGQWCGKHSIAFSGHLMAEKALSSQTAYVGDATRLYRGFQVPGIDMLCDAHEYTTAKQAQSAAHQYGRCGVLSELYGVTGWGYDFVGHKAQGDWQAALGITVRVPHLWWVSMAGEAKRDYPAAIGYQSPWYKEYPLVEDHFARVNTVLTRGKPRVRVGVIHPIESYWLCNGPADQTKAQRQQRDQAFEDITQWLLFALADFNYISEANLPAQSPRQAGPRFTVGQMAYDVVFVPGLRTIRSTTLDRLEQFADAGGTVVFAGEIPALVDALPSDRARKLADRCTRVDYTQEQVARAVTPFRDLEIRHADGKPADSILYQMRVDGEGRHVFLVNTDRAQGREGSRIRLRGDWNATWLDTMTGNALPLACTRSGEWTELAWDFAPHGHLLLTLQPGHRDGGAVFARKAWNNPATLRGPVPVTLAEPNVLLLDQPQWRLNDGPWQASEEILRLDDKVRDQLGIPRRGGGMAQPWTDHEPVKVLAKLQLKFVINAQVAVSAPQLAMEQVQRAGISVDGADVSSKATGWWVDESIQTCALPALAAGRHELLLSIPFTRKTNVEWFYLLGNFGVKVQGRDATLVALPDSLALGDWVEQGLPFYAGNATYHFRLEGEGKPALLEIPEFKAPLLSILLDGKPAGKIAFAPFQLELGTLPAGTHSLDVTVYGNRVNSFGCLHNTNPKLRWIGPAAWRSSGKEWSYDYAFRAMGILAPPVVKTLP